MPAGGVSSSPSSGGGLSSGAMGIGKRAMPPKNQLSSVLPELPEEGVEELVVDEGGAGCGVFEFESGFILNSQDVTGVQRSPKN